MCVRTRIFIRFMILLTVLVCGYLTAELALRATDTFLINPDVHRSDCYEARPAPLLWVYRPFTCGTNEYGFLDSSFESQQSIAVIGDSVAAGQYVDPSKRFANLIDSGEEVAVLARSGYGMSQQLELLPLAETLNVTLLIWSYVLNDPVLPEYHGGMADGNGSVMVYRPKTYVVYELKKRLFFFQEGRIARIKDCSTEFHFFMHCTGSDRVSKGFAHLADWRDRTGIPVLVLIHPVFSDEGHFRDAYEYLPIHRDIHVLLESRGLPYVDVADLYHDRLYVMDVSEYRYGFDSWHPNEEGHAIIADALTEWIGVIE